MAISKLEAARRQLDSAIDMFFDNKDSLAIQTLAYAAFRVLYDLYGNSESDGFLEHLNDLLHPLGWKAFTQVPNFLKHADSDPGGILVHHSAEETISTIGIACVLYGRQAGEMTAEMLAFDLWNKAMLPELFKLPPDADEGFEQMYREAVKVIKGSPWEIQIMIGKSLLDDFRENPAVVEARNMRYAIEDR